MSDNIEEKTVVINVEVNADEAKIDRINKKVDNLENKKKRRIKKINAFDITGDSHANIFSPDIKKRILDRQRELDRNIAMEERLRKRRKAFESRYSDHYLGLFGSRYATNRTMYGFNGFHSKLKGFRPKPKDRSIFSYTKIPQSMIFNDIRQFYEKENAENIFNRVIKEGEYETLFRVGNNPAETYLNKKNKGVFSRFRRPKFSTMNDEPVKTFTKPDKIAKMTKTIDNYNNELKKQISYLKPISEAMHSQASTFKSSAGKYSNARKRFYNTEAEYAKRIHIARQRDLDFAFGKNDIEWSDAPSRNKFIRTIQKKPKTSKMQKPQRVPSTKGGNNMSYANSAFHRNMMYLGSAMLIQYAIGMVVRGVANTLTKVADTEVQTLQGNAFRNDLIKRGQNVGEFDEATKRYSELSGTSSFASRAKFAGIYGRLRGAGIETNNLDGNTLVETIRGLELYTGDTGEQVDKKLFDLLSGKASKNERKEFGVTAQNNPVEILKQIHSTLEKNPFASVGMNRSLLKDVLNNIVQIPQEMVQNVHSKFPEIFNDMANSIKNFADGFFGTKDEDVEKRWIALFATIRSVVEKVFTEDGGKWLAVAVTDSIGGAFATLRDTITAVEKTISALNKGFEDLKKTLENIPGYKTIKPVVGKIGDVADFATDLMLNPGSLVLPALTSLYEKGATPRGAYQGSYMTGAPTQSNGIILNGNNVYIDSYGVKIDSKINEVMN